MMLRQWSRRCSVTSTLGRRLLQRPAAIQRTNAVVGGRATAAISTIANDSSSWIHHRSNDHICNLPTAAAARVFSSAAEEYHPEPRPFKKIMAGKHYAKIRKQKMPAAKDMPTLFTIANIYTIIVRLIKSCIISL